MPKYIVKHNTNILRNNSDDDIVGYDYTPIAEFVVEGESVGTSQVDVVEDTPINFTNMSTNSTSWYWTFGSTATPTTSTLENPTGITYSTSGVTETVTLTVYNSLTNDTKTRTNYINITKLLGKVLYINVSANPSDSDPKEWTWNPSGGTSQTSYFTSFHQADNVVGKSHALYYEDGTVSDYRMVVVVKFNAEYNNGSTTSNGVYPGGSNGTMDRNWASWYDDTGIPEVSISGLTTSNTYKFTFFGSRTTFTATTRYTITGGTSKDNTYVDLDTNDNYLNTVSVSSISPSSSGKINFTSYWQNSQAFLGVIQINEGE